jgi:coatomer subunit epsilon
LVSPPVDAVALIVQIHLQQNRNDLALKEVTAARRWGQDSLLVNLAESWVALRQVRPSRKEGRIAQS